MAKIRSLAERDLSEAQRIVRRAFGTFMGVPDLDNFWTDFDYVYGRFGAEHTASFAADQDGALAGVNFATNWGSAGFLVRCLCALICGTTALPNRLSQRYPISSSVGGRITPACALFPTARSTSGYIRSLTSTRVISRCSWPLPYPRTGRPFSPLRRATRRSRQTRVAKPKRRAGQWPTRS